MARDITSGFQTAIEAQSLQVADFIKIEYDSGDLRLWGGYGDVTFEGETYTGAGNLIAADFAKETKDFQANGAAFGLSGLDASIVAIALAEPYQGRKITAWIGIMNDAGAVTDSYQVFSGKVDVMTIRDTGSAADISVAAESDAIGLSREFERRYTDEDQRARYPDDTGFSYVAVQQDIELAWGAGL